MHIVLKAFPAELAKRKWVWGCKAHAFCYRFGRKRVLKTPFSRVKSRLKLHFFELFSVFRLYHPGYFWIKMAHNCGISFQGCNLHFVELEFYRLYSPVLHIVLKAFPAELAKTFTPGGVRPMQFTFTLGVTVGSFQRRNR